jgi:hypothetical protein
MVSRASIRHQQSESKRKFIPDPDLEKVYPGSGSKGQKATDPGSGTLVYKNQK